MSVRNPRRLHDVAGDLFGDDVYADLTGDLRRNATMSMLLTPYADTPDRHYPFYDPISSLSPAGQAWWREAAVAR